MLMLIATIEQGEENMVVDVLMRPGLEGVIAAETRLSHVDGQVGELVIAGYSVEEIAPHATFEELVYLLWNNRLPGAGERAEFQAALAARRALPEVALTVLQAAAAKQLPVIDALRMAAGVLNLVVDADNLEAAAQTMVAAFPTIVAAYWRLLHGQAPIAPDVSLSHGANTLYMLTGEKPSAEKVRALETYLNTVSDHGFNASTFTARIIASTHSDMISAVVGAIGALKGPLHGGAPGPALDMVLEIAKPENAEPYIRRKLEAKEVLMGFGHRVYKVRDPRADVLDVAAAQFFKTGEQAELYNLARHVEQVALRLLEEYKPGRNLKTNVEFYTALVLHGIGLHNDLFTPTFAIGRVAGWTAHAIEHRTAGRIIRPLSSYTGDKDKTWN
jgi:citrate synthase